MLAPSLRSAMAKEVPPYDQGRLQGGMTFLTSLATVFGNILSYHCIMVYLPWFDSLFLCLCIGPVMMAGIYSGVKDNFTGIAFMLG
jgi:hypothetical protein